MSLADIAARAGVAKATVSKVMNHYPGVSAATRQRVWEAAQTLGVLPRAYRTAPGEAERTVLLLPMAESIFDEFRKAPNQLSANMYHGFQQALVERKYDLLLGPAGLGEDDAIAYVRDGIGQRFSAVALLPPVPPALTQFLHHRRIPTICLSGGPNDPHVAAITADHGEGTRMIMRHLFDLGHRRIGYVGSGFHSRSFFERFQAFLLEMHIAGLTVKRQWVMQPPISQTYEFADRFVERWHDQIERFFQKMVERGDLPTALVCINDDFARKVLELLAMHGLRVPDDISVTGWGNETELSLTTVEADPQHTGAMGARWLLTMMREKEANTGRMLVPVRLVMGSSTGRISDV